MSMPSDARPILLAITLAVPGGTTSLVLAFAKWLVLKKIPVVVAAGDQGDWLEDRCREAHIPFRRIAHLRRAIHPIHDLLAVRSFAALLHEVKPRALHLNSSKAGVIGSLAARLTGTSPVVYCIGGWAALEAKGILQRAAYLWPERLSSGWKDSIICLHPGDQAFAKANGIRPRHRLEVIPNGIDIEQVRSSLLPREQARLILGLPAGSPIIGTIANFFPAKDLPRYIDTCALVLKQRPDARLCLIGDGAGRAEIEAKIRAHGLERSIILCGAREHAARFLSAFDLFVLPSKKEGMPFVLLEAAAAGLPIVTTDVGAHAWMLPEAVIVPPEQSQALASAILETLDRPAPSYEKSLSRFHEEACFSAHLRLLLES